MISSCTATVSPVVVALLAIAACASSSTAAAAEWSPEEIGAIADAAANSRHLETIDSSGIVKRTPSVRLCGDQLVNAIVLACSQFRRKRSAENDIRSLYTSIFKPTTATGDAEDPGYGAVVNARGRGGWLIEPPTSALHRPRGGDSAAYRKFETVGMLRHLSKRAPGPVEECCRTPCQLQQLTNYC